MSQPKKHLSAVQLRLILGGLILVVIGLTTFGFYQANKVLTSYANAVAQANGNARISESNVQRLKNTKAELEKNQEAVSRVTRITADSNNYQNQVINDLSAYAQQADINILGFSFDTGAATAGTGAAMPTAGTLTPAPAAGGKTAKVVVQLDATVPYANFLQFVHAIEQNLTQMRISKLNLAKVSSGTDPNLIAGQSLAIEVYIK